MTAERRLAEACRLAADHWYGVPGFPVTGLVDAVGARLPVNEKVGLEHCLGHSLVGRRAGLIVKHVGLNACADPLVQATTQGLSAGVVVLVGDDLDGRWSENVQDSRYYGEVAEVPVIEPGHGNALECVEEAFRLSETHSRVVLVRLTPPLLEGGLQGDPLLREVRARPRPGLDLTHRGRYQRARRGTRALFSWSTGSRLNRPGAGETGVGASGGAARITTVYPPPGGIGPVPIRELGRPFVQEHRHLHPPPDAGEPETYQRRGRRSTLCPGCPFGPAIALLRERGLVPVCDTGCALFALAPPYEHGIPGFGLGSSIGVAATSTGVALSGDYAFLHSGINALIEAYATGTPLLAVILQNRCLAMTGRQASPDVAAFLDWSGPAVVEADDHEALRRVLVPPERPTTVIIRGRCPDGARYGTVEY
ncbi:MAG TPA: thiamine pyrophosphate-dependent enzyme [Methanoregulaceae archaeon]|nr:thiamine pyrophosphate-dependent enzyme [Methanoregulaceae archaeon]HQJ88911.1 thiamine pyrophosphate-dependent enzyme [Methanoregulaceae archaeon]